ncbi:type IV pilus modification PilV family protein [Aliivibrio wodanis]|uniref:type IV pilus modification PilV family protein n=1 Tax=Aliivibrio wodanis TaxID=80852 RepID=UPI00406C84BD
MAVFKQSNAGFSLIENILAIVLSSIVVAGMITIFYPLAQKSSDPIMQVRATELAQMTLQEIFSRRFDEQSDLAGNNERCGEIQNCTSSANLGTDSEPNKSQWDDVDDFITSINNECVNRSDFVAATTMLGLGLPAIYQNYNVCVSVTYPTTTLDGVTLNSESLIKLVQVTLLTPNNSRIEFSALRSNY